MLGCIGLSMLLGSLVDFLIMFWALFVLSELIETGKYSHTYLALVNLYLPILWLQNLFNTCILSISLFYYVFLFLFILVSLTRPLPLILISWLILPLVLCLIMTRVSLVL